MAGAQEAPTSFLACLLGIKPQLHPDLSARTEGEGEPTCLMLTSSLNSQVLSLLTIYKGNPEYIKQLMVDGKQKKK